MTKLVVISDTHCTYPELPAADILIHCGDWTFQGKRNEIKKNQAWLNSQAHKFKHILGTPGNHDFNFHKGTFDNLKLLFNEGIELEGLKIWGCPMTPTFGGWAFMASEGYLHNEVFSKIPEGLDILFCHGPAKGFLDMNYNGDHCGSTALRERLLSMKQPPRHFFFGHIHPNDNRASSRRTNYRGSINFYNVAYLDEHYTSEFDNNNMSLYEFEV